MSVAEHALPAVEPGILSPQRRAMTIGLVSLVSLVAFEALAVATAMPTAAQALDGLSLYALAFGGVIAASVVGLVAAGRWCDVRGAAVPLQAGVVAFVVGLALAGLAPNMPLFVAGRIAQGFGQGLLLVATYVVVAKVYPSPLRPRLFAAFSAAWVVPSLVGPTISGLVVEHAGWRWVFLAVPFLALPALWMLRPGLRALPPPAPSDAPAGFAHRRMAWSLVGAAGACALHYAGQRHDAAGFALIAAATVAVAVCAWRLLPAGVLVARRGLPAVIALRGIAAAAFFSTEVFVPLMLSRERGLSPVWAGLALTVGALGWSAGSWYQGTMSRKGPRPSVLRLGMTLIGGGVATVAATAWAHVPAAVGIAGWTIAGLGMGLAYPILAALALDLSAPGEEGVNSSALQLSEALTVATVLALGGSLFATLLETSPTLAFVASYAVSVALASLGMVVAGRCRR